MAKPRRGPRQQFAALPWRPTAQGVEVLLITSRETRRWVIPKGWGKSEEAPATAAAREALEETGVEGVVAEVALGVYRYPKLLRDGSVRSVRVVVHALRVMFEHDDWPERTLRDKLWVNVVDAVELVDEPELKSLLSTFRPEPDQAA